MSAAAEVYYKQRAADLAITGIPPILGSEPLQLVPNTTARPVTRGLRYALRAFESVEPFVIAGVPHTYKALHQSLEQPAWQTVQGIIPTRSYDTPAEFIRKRLGPLADSMRRNSFPLLTLEAVSRDEIPRAVLKRPFKNNGTRSLHYIGQEYEASQAYLLARTYDEDGVAKESMLTIMQGLAHPDILKKQFMAVRYFGALLLPREVAIL